MKSYVASKLPLKGLNANCQNAQSAIIHCHCLANAAKSHYVVQYVHNRLSSILLIIIIKAGICRPISVTRIRVGLILTLSVANVNA